MPRDIWDEGFAEGERRMKRRLPGQASTGLLGGFDVMVGLLVVVTLTGAVSSVTNDDLAHAIGALPFGLAFVFLTIGRSELFTENFLVPVGAFLAGRGSFRELLRMWVATLVFNFVGIALLASFLTIDGVLPNSAYEAAGTLGTEFVDRGFLEALASAIVAGTAITLFTWLTIAAKNEGTRVAVAMLIGYVLLLPVLNHAVVSFGELMLGLMSGTTHAGAWDIIWRLAVAVVGNTIGGIGFVTTTRLVQVSGEPHDEEHAKRNSLGERLFIPSSGSTGSEVSEASASASGSSRSGSSSESGSE